MSCRPLKSIYFDGIETKGDLLIALDQELEDLADIANEVDFANDEDRLQFQRNVVFIKGYFERYERILNNVHTK